MSFVPNENSRASLLLDYVVGQLLNAGDSMSYREIMDLCGITNESLLPDSMLASGIVAEVNKRLHRMGDWRVLVNVISTGYKIGSPAELRELALGQNKHAARTLGTAQRVTEAVVRHPDSTVAERKRAADATAAQGALLQIVRREQRKIAMGWPAEERSPVTVDTPDDESD